MTPLVLKRVVGRLLYRCVFAEVGGAGAGSLSCVGAEVKGRRRWVCVVEASIVAVTCTGKKVRKDHDTSNASLGAHNVALYKTSNIMK